MDVKIWSNGEVAQLAEQRQGKLDPRINLKSVYPHAIYGGRQLINPNLCYMARVGLEPTTSGL